MNFKPVGQRPRCLHCGKELAPQFREMLPGYGLPGNPLQPSELAAWKKDNPGWRAFTGHYGRYSDDRFCGLTCGYSWAFTHAQPATLK